ncbi:hypothetical protein [Escherichia coli]|uniref:hypothetical protein n=1 Tax=Escherichia coli TaxID=562 RepID=UPI0028DA09EB|nr:hypothetical protein [Escherichia coli]MDT8661037.1 hypothetical protein [Escherichia coli]
MLKSTLIAKCLYQNRMVSGISIGESAVKSIFEEHFTGHDFNKWNTKLPPAVSTRILKATERASTIRVNYFIKDLWDL